MIVRTWTSEAEIPRFKCVLSHSTVVWSWERNLQQFYCLVKEARLIILVSTVFLCMPPHPSAWEPLSDQVAVYSCRFNGLLPVSFVGTPPSSLHRPGTRISIQPSRSYKNENHEVYKWVTGNGGESITWQIRNPERKSFS